jgi:uncharacterized Ntn-hydrolase superfamily protein
VTYSLVACDLERREWGVAVQSKFLAVGAAVPYCEAEVGAIATQSYVNVAYGPDGLALLRNGAPAGEAVRFLTASDQERELRQLGIVDRLGRSATFTGSGCHAWAGGRTGDGYAAQGNILVSEATVDALAETFEATAGRTVAERLLAALAAGEAAGGDRRGRQSAALLVVREGGGYGGGSDRLVDLRVDDHAEPVDELRRIFAVHQLLFGETPEEEWITVDEALARELGDRLAGLGYASGNLGADLAGWAGVENLEERVRGSDRVDPVLLAELRRRGPSS